MHTSRLQLSKLQKGKIAAHILQALLMFVGLCILFAVLTQGGHNDGRVFWYLILCFLSVPAWIYLIMTPMWERTVRFANGFAMAGVDVVYTIFWFAAFIALAAYNHSGKEKGAKEKNISGGGNCTTFAYGPEKKCELAKATIGLGVVIFLLWAITSGISIYFLLRWRKGDGFPWKNAQPKTYHEPTSVETQTKDAWSSNVHEASEHGSDDGRITPQPSSHGDEESIPLHATATENGGHPGTPWGPLSNPPSYHSERPEMPEESYYRSQSPNGFRTPGALSPAAYNAHDSGYDRYQPGNHVFDSTNR